jgi:hypothetical protein
MVARISTPSSINRALNYNENKVKNGQAILLHSEGFLKDTGQLNFYDKLKRFTDLIELNGRAKTNSLHISLNFSNSDKIDTEKLVEIAGEYMSKIGFGQQPYLLYQHMDAGHPHLHIVTTTIREDGSRIDTFNIGRNQSEKARKAIEQSFGLVRAEDSKRRQASELKPVSVPRVEYGRTETKRSITNALHVVLNNYKFASLPELNAVLKLYNITADRGSESSRIYQNKGLTYRLLDKDGNKVGVPIKASDFYSKPTLKYLEEKYAPNEAVRQPHKPRVKNGIDLYFFKRSGKSLPDLVKALEKDGISTVIRQNTEGLIYGITYVDHKTKCVFNGSDLGKQYSAKGLQERLGSGVSETINSRSRQTHYKVADNATSLNPATGSKNDAEQAQTSTGSPTLFEGLMQPEQSVDFVPHQLKQKNKKKKQNKGFRM